MLFFNELKKTLGKRTILLFVTICSLSGVFLIISEKNRDYLFYAEDYKAIYKRPEMNGTADQAKAYINSLDTGEITAEYFLIRYIKSEVDDTLGYTEYRDNIIASAKRLSMISVFSAEDGFSCLNMEKTADVYAELPIVQTKIGPGRGVVMASDYVGSLAFEIAFMIFIVFSLIVREKEIGSLNLTLTTVKGHKPHGILKLFVCMVTAFISIIVLESINWILAGVTYGIGDILRPIQSIPEYMSCIFDISVLEFIIITILFRSAFVIMITSLIFFIACIGRTYLSMLIILVTVFGTEGALYFSISGKSIFGLLKYINIFSGANSGFLIGDYLNLNVFGKPVWYLPIYICFMILLLIILYFLGIFAYDRIDNTLAKSFGLRYDVIPVKSRSIFLQECFRYLFCEKTVLIVLGFLIFRAVVFKPVREIFDTPEDIYYKQYMLQFEGLYSEEKARMIEKEWETYENIKEEYVKALNKTNDENVKSLMSDKFMEETKKYDVLGRVEYHGEYLKEKGGAFIYDAGYKIITNDTSGKKENRTLALMAAFMMVVCASFMYAPDYQTGVDKIVRSTVKGRMKLFLNREILGTIILLITFLATYIPFFISVLDVYGSSGFSFPACSMEHLSWVHVWISIRGYLIIISILRFFVLWVEMNIVYLISTKVRSISYTFIIGTALFVLPLIFFI